MQLQVAQQFEGIEVRRALVGDELQAPRPATASATTPVISSADSRTSTTNASYRQHSRSWMSETLGGTAPMRAGPGEEPRERRLNPVWDKAMRVRPPGVDETTYDGHAGVLLNLKHPALGHHIDDSLATLDARDDLAHSLLDVAPVSVLHSGQEHGQAPTGARMIMRMISMAPPTVVVTITCLCCGVSGCSSHRQRRSFAGSGCGTGTGMRRPLRYW